MKKLSATIAKLRLFSQSGFTMIELLVVIAVIGILTVAVISSIDPIEQINKGRDTRKRSNAAQLINALDRFYAIQERYPWNTVTYGGVETAPSLAFPGGVNNCTTATVNGNQFCVVGGTGFTIGATATDDNYWLRGLSETSEVKESFITTLAGQSITNTLYLSKADDDDLYICFAPASNQFKLEAANACTDPNRVAEMPAGSCATTDGTMGTDAAPNLICLP